MDTAFPIKTEYDFLVNMVFSRSRGYGEGRDYFPEDIDWIGTKYVEVDVNRFLEILKEIPMGSIPPFENGFCGWYIVMKDGNWFEGDLNMEWGDYVWTFHEIPRKPDEIAELSGVEDIVGDIFDNSENEESE